MKKKFGSKMIKTYKNQFKEHGNNPASLGCPKGRQEHRFKALSKFLKKDSSLLDFGCGFADLLTFLKSNGFHGAYEGCDLIDEFLDTAKKNHPDTNFFKSDLGENMDKKYDHIICPGAFNVMYSNSKKEHSEFVKKTITNLFECSTKMLSVDFLSPFVDFNEEDAFHQEVNQIMEFINKNITKRAILDHSYLPYEYCIHLYKNDTIVRPQNVFAAES